MPKTERGHTGRWHPAQLPSHKLCSLEDINEIADTLGNVSRIGRHRLLAKLPVIAYKYEQEHQASVEPSLSMQQSQFTKIRNAADALLKHIFAEGRTDNRIVQSGHFWELPEAIRAPLERATEIEARTLHQQWQAAGREEPGYDPNFPPLPYPPNTKGQGVHYQSAARLNAAIWGVRLIQRAAATAADDAASKTKPGRGGNRHGGKTAEVILLESLFQLHDDLHRRDPEHIGRPAVNTSRKIIGGLTLGFVQACLNVLGRHEPELLTVSEDTIRHRFRSWKTAKSKI